MLYSLLFAFASLSTLTTASQRVERATAVLQPEQTKPIHGLRNVRGTVTFRRINNGKNRGNIRVSGEIRGLKANQEHGFHVHEFGDISSSNPGKPIDCDKTGAHFDPKNTKLHRGRNNKNGHQGDFGNIKANRNGVARFDFVDKFISLNGGSSVIGRGLVIHEKRDDLRSQPIGKAGGRVSCGTVGIADNRKGRSIEIPMDYIPNDINDYIPNDYKYEYDESTTMKPMDYDESTMKPTDYKYEYDESTTMKPTDYEYDESTMEPTMHYKYGEYYDESTMEPTDYDNDEYDESTTMEPSDYDNNDYDESTTMEPNDYDQDYDMSTTKKRLLDYEY